MEDVMQEDKVIRLDDETCLRDAVEELKDCSEETQRQACDAFERREPRLAQELRKRLVLGPKIVAPFRRRVLGKPVEQQKPVEQREHEPQPATDIGKLIDEVVGDTLPKHEFMGRAKFGNAILTFQHAKSPTGIPSSLENAMVGVAGMNVHCRYDVFHNRYLIEGHDCGLRGDEDLDTVCLKVREAVLKRFRFDPGERYTMDAVLLRGRDNMFDPVRDYLDGLRWDGVKRIDDWLIKYCRAKDTLLNRAIGRKVLIAAVRRVKQPGCKFDYVLVLEGAQGVGKSTLIKLLAGEDNYTDAEILGLKKQEQQEAVQGIWLYELAELEGMSRSEVTAVKLLLSKTVDSARPAYGRSRIDRPRRCIFFATTNDETYLRGMTGNRRFWPVEVGVIDLNGIGRDRDQLWAETVLAEGGGEELVIGSDLWADVAVKQQSKTEVDPWTDTISGWLSSLEPGIDGKVLVGNSDGQYVRAFDSNGNREWRVASDFLLTEIIKTPIERQHNNHSKRLAAVMRLLGWHKPDTVLRIGNVIKNGFTLPVTLREYTPALGQWCVRRPCFAHSRPTLHLEPRDSRMTDVIALTNFN
jgi:hypothetical protein